MMLADDWGRMIRRWIFRVNELADCTNTLSPKLQ